MAVNFECPACGYVAPGPLVYSFHVDRICRVDAQRTDAQRRAEVERELRKLIREQANDMKNGHKVYPDWRLNPFSLDRVHGEEGTILDFLEDTGNGTAKDHWPLRYRHNK